MALRLQNHGSSRYFYKDFLSFRPYVVVTEVETTSGGILIADTDKLIGLPETYHDLPSTFRIRSAEG